ncbi:patatin-like protein [Sphingomonas qomolangmaensis]|uniref:Patatin-like protein n=1 Tax=Sphingomonas qomolangmaensis TaxID=2918765 RepID=A0ABY5LCS4_9SPHN|nr:patatin-like protein [Sphingomonas qomolangmaensis]UUL83696.1 patatin-like protein [Sphingomonas qomolangmaensis]
MRDKELRLALVCYGGISLAVYMHGITKEVWRLARASQAFCDPLPAPGSGEEDVYRELLGEIAEVSGLRVRVLVDILAGASAGGINSVFLAQAISTGQSLEPLTAMWLEQADIDSLIDPDQAPSSGMTKFWARPLAWMAMGADAIEETVEHAARGEVRNKLNTLVRARWFEPPFGGKRMVTMLLDAFAAMEKAPTGPRLLPPGQPLDLFVTVTDFGGHPERLRLNSPPEVLETEHRLVLSFSDGGKPVDTLADHAELAFAARSTSSFPGAFPPFMVGELDEVLADRGATWPGRLAFLTRALPRQVAANAVESAALIDGSVLANAPFRPAIDALRERPARRQVDRRFVFIDPIPGFRFGLGAGRDGQPSFFQTMIGALSEIPRQQPIRDNLDMLMDRSDQIERKLAILDQLRGEVERQVESVFGYTLFLDYPNPKRLTSWRRRAQAAASGKAGYGHAGYSLLKVEGVIDRVAGILHHIGDQSGQERRRAIRGAVAEAVRLRGGNKVGTEHPTGASPRAVAFLRGFDIGYRIRRLRLLVRRIAELDGDHDRAELREVREAVYAALAAYLERHRAQPMAMLQEQVRQLPAGAEAVLDSLEATMDLQGLDTATDEALAGALSRLPRDARRPLLLAYLGFPFFDIATLPLLQGEGLDEFDPVRVDRIAPDDAVAIRSGGAAATLKGIQFNNFGAFFSRAYRENDYLWGRLHGADRLVDIVLSTLPATVRLKAGRTSAIKRSLFLAILDEEEPRLTAMPGLIDSLRAEIG